MSRKRNREQFTQSQGLQQYTLDNFGFNSQSIERNKRFKQDLLYDFQNTLQRLMEHQEIVDAKKENYKQIQIQHQTLEQRRKKFQDKMKSNKLFRIMLAQFPQIQTFTNIQIQKMFIKRNFLNLQQKYEIVELRFGSYGNYENNQKSYSKIAQKVGAKVSTVISVVRTYKKREGKFQLKNGGGGGRKKIISDEIKQEICQIQKLKQWAHLSLEKRCDQIYEEYSIKISRFTLSNIYKQNQVGYLKTHKSFFSTRSEIDLTHQRLQYIYQLSKYLQEKKEIIYMDETSTNVWESKYKMWQPQNSIIPMVYSLPNKRGSNVTIIGAITNFKTQIYYNITNNTSTLTVLEFYRYLNKKIKLRNKVIIMDNHPAHHAKLVTEFIQRQGGILLFMPPISSYFNPIETMWSWVKSRWRNQLIDLKGSQPSAQFMGQTLKNICETAPPNIVSNIANSVISYITKYFNEFSEKQEDLEWLE